MTKETKQFQTEITQIFDIMVNSLYSQREIFLRELISNSSDSLDKVRYEQITKPELQTGQELHIRLTSDKKAHTLTIADNGIGMTYDEAVQNLGTVAYSGTKEFIKRTKDLAAKPELIGQFGVGFYSAFMVADKVQVITQKAGTSQATLWESTGNGEFTVETTTRPEGHGTSVILHLKKLTADDGSEGQDFTDEWTLKTIVRKYSDFIEFPIKMEVEKIEDVKDENGKAIEGKTETKLVDEILNTRKALWLRAPKDVTKDEYTEFYKHVSRDWSEPLETIHYKAEGSQEFSSLVYIPSNLPFDYHHRDMKYGLSLYVKRVFITDNCEHLIPPYLRFLKGVVDSSDLPLNISRELLQKDRQINLIKKAIVSKMLRVLKTMLEKERAKYVTFWEKFGVTLKEGIASDFDNKDALKDLLIFKSSTSAEYSTLKEYVARMKPEQTAVYYFLGENMQKFDSSPYLEKLNKKGFEVVFLTDPIDEWVMNAIPEFEGKKLVSITKENLELDTEAEKKANEETLKSLQEKFKGLTDLIRTALDESIKEVKISDRLVDSPVCLVSGANDPSAHMERILESMGQEVPKRKRILEINPSHPVFERMLALPEDKRKGWAEILYNQALLNEGSPIKDPMRFSKQISELMIHG